MQADPSKYRGVNFGSTTSAHKQAYQRAKAQMQTRRKLQHPCNNFRHKIEIKRVGVGGLMFNEIKYDHKKQQGVRLNMNKC